MITNAKLPEIRCLSLPFTEALEVEGDCFRIEYWKLCVDNDYSRACSLGRDYADELIEYMSKSLDVSLLPRVIAAMVAMGAGGGVEVGFLTRIAEAAIN